MTGYAHSDPEFTKNVINSLYVDDYASSFSTKSEAFLVYQKLKEAFKTGGFNMRKWDSNCPELLKDIQKAENSVCSQDSKQKKLEAKTVQESSATKVLGILWDQNSEKMVFDLSVMTADAQLEHVTKRSALSTIARFYDPLGLLSPITVPLKQIYQVVCKMKVNWDAQRPQEIRNKWGELMQDIAANTLVDIDRCVLSDLLYNDICKFELHGFSDASNIAYGAAIYLRVVTHHVTVVRLLAAKSKLAPVKVETTPRLELRAAVVLAKLINSIKMRYVTLSISKTGFAGQILTSYFIGFITNIKHKSVSLRTD